MTTGEVFQDSSTALTNRTVRLCTIILACSIFAIGAGSGQSLRGVVISDHSGQGPYASGTLQLAVGEKIYDLSYGEPLKRNFSSNICSDIGAIWTVAVRRLAESSLDIVSASCKGEVDEARHKAWSLADTYLRTEVHDPILSLSVLSERLLASVEFESFHQSITNLDIGGYQTFGRSGTCIDVLSIKQRDRVELRAGADCYLELDGSPIYIFFTVVKNAATNIWKIDTIKLERTGAIPWQAPASLHCEALPRHPDVEEESSGWLEGRPPRCSHYCGGTSGSRAG